MQNKTNKTGKREQLANKLNTTKKCKLKFPLNEAVPRKLDEAKGGRERLVELIGQQIDGGDISPEAKAWMNNLLESIDVFKKSPHISKSGESQEVEIYEAPPSQNGFWSHTGKRKYITNRGREFKQYVELQLKSLVNQKKLYSFGDKRLAIDYEFFFRGKRKRDTSNYVKVVEDCFSGILFDDDEQVDYFTAKRYYNSETNMFRVRISVIEDDGKSRPS